MMNKKKPSVKVSPMKQTSKAAMMKKEDKKMSPAKMKCSPAKMKKGY